MPLTTAEKSKLYRERLKNNPEKYKVSKEKSRVRSAKNYVDRFKAVDEDKKDEMRLKWRQIYASKKKSQSEELSASSSTKPPSVEKADYIIETRLSTGPLRCSFCKAQILRKIYKCVQCEDVTLCSKCERSDKHPIHCVLRIACKDLYVKMKVAFPTIHRLFGLLLTADEDFVYRDSEDENSRSGAGETNPQDETHKTVEVPCNVAEGTIDSQTLDKEVDLKTCSRTPDSKTKSDRSNSKKRKRKVDTNNSKKSNTANYVNTIFEPAICLTELSPTHTDPLNFDYNIKTEPVEEDNTDNVQRMNVTIDIEIEPAEVKKEPVDESTSDL